MENRLYSAKYLKQIIEEHRFKFSKSLGQNFLIDGNIVKKIVRDAGITKDDYILEVGPGIGTLTEELSLRAKKVVAVEIDKNLLPILDITLKRYENIEIFHGDILDIDIKKLIEERLEGGPVKVVAILPYYVTTPIIARFLEEDLNVESLTIMVQKEVAQRMVSKEGSKVYGSLSVFVNFYSEPEILLNVPKSVFMPSPKIDSAVIRLNMKEKLPQVDKDQFFKVVKASFSKRRKTILNALSSYGFQLTKEEFKTALEKAGIDPKSRAEELNLEQFVSLSEVLPLLKMEA